MNLPSLLDKTYAILRRDILSGVRYRTGFLLTASATIAELAAFYYLSRAIGPGFRPQGLDYFAFLLVGTGFYTFLLMGINSFLQIVQEAQQTGTLEILMTTSTPGPVLISLSAVSAFARNTVQLFIYIAAGVLVLGTPLHHPNLGGCLLVFMLSVAIAVAIGMFAATLQLAIQKGSAVVWLLGSGAWFMTGTLFPVTTLPAPLRAISQWIPMTYSLDGMRLALFGGSDVHALNREYTVLFLFAITLVPLSVLAFSYALRRARMNGTLSFY